MQMWLGAQNVICKVPRHSCSVSHYISLSVCGGLFSLEVYRVIAAYGGIIIIVRCLPHLVTGQKCKHSYKNWLSSL